MRIEGCIFDLDGVIVDTARYHFQAWRKMAQLFGGDLTHEQNETLKGVSRMASLDYILKENGIEKSLEEKKELARKKNEWYLDLIDELDESEMLPGVLDLIKELHDKDILIGLGSASKNAITILKKLGIDHYFKTMVDGNSVEKSKPNPEVFIKGVNGLGIDPAHCIVFEDSSKGIAAANTGGFIPIGIGNPEYLHEAVKVYSGFEDLHFEMILKDLAEKS